MKKVFALLFAGVLAVFLAGCPQQTAEEFCTDADSGTEMSFSEAKQIAEASDCVNEGPLKDEHWCNNATGTWWISLNVDKPGCSPACVVKISDKTAEINWMCTGLIPPTQ